MKKICITGSLASGKTTASKILSLRRGPLFSADEVVKKLYKQNHFIPKIDRRTKAGKEQYAEEMKTAEGKKVFDEEIHQLIKTIVENVKKDDLAKKYILGECENSHYLKHKDIKVRVRPDCINRVAGFISDVKTCQNNNPKAFKSDVFLQQF